MVTQTPGTPEAGGDQIERGSHERARAQMKLERAEQVERVEAQLKRERSERSKTDKAFEIVKAVYQWTVQITVGRDFNLLSFTGEVIFWTAMVGLFLTGLKYGHILEVVVILFVGLIAYTILGEGPDGPTDRYL